MPWNAPRRSGVALTALTGLVGIAWLAQAWVVPDPPAPDVSAPVLLHVKRPAATFPPMPRMGLQPVHDAAEAAWREATGLPMSRTTLWLAGGAALTYRPALAGHPWGLVIRPGWLYRAAHRVGLAPPTLPPTATPYGWVLSPDPSFAEAVAKASPLDTAAWSAIRAGTARDGESPLGKAALTMELDDDRDASIRATLRMPDGNWSAGPMQSDARMESAALAVHAPDGVALYAVVDALADALLPHLALPDPADILPGVRLPAWLPPNPESITECAVALVGVDHSDLLPWPVFAARGRSTEAAPFSEMLAGLPAIPHQWGPVEGTIAPILGEHLTLCVAHADGLWVAASQERALTWPTSIAPWRREAQGRAWLIVGWTPLAEALSAWLPGAPAAKAARDTWLRDTLPALGGTHLIAKDPPSQGELVFHGALFVDVP